MLATLPFADTSDTSNNLQVLILAPKAIPKEKYLSKKNYVGSSKVPVLYSFQSRIVLVHLIMCNAESFESNFCSINAEVFAHMFPIGLRTSTDTRGVVWYTSISDSWV